MAEFSNKSDFIHDKFNKELNPVGFSCHLVQIFYRSAQGLAREQQARHLQGYHICCIKIKWGGGVFFNVSFKVLQE